MKQGVGNIPYQGNEAKILKKVLVRLNIIQKNQDLPIPISKLTGVQGKYLH